MVDHSTFNPGWITLAGIALDLLAVRYLIKDWGLQQRKPQEWSEERKKEKRKTVSDLKDMWSKLCGIDKLDTPNFEKMNAQEALALREILPFRGDDPEIVEDKKRHFKEKFGIGFKNDEFESTSNYLEKLSICQDVETYRKTIKSENFSWASNCLILGLILQGIGTYISMLDNESREFSPTLEMYEELDRSQTSDLVPR